MLRSAGAHADAMHDHAHLAGCVERIAGRVVNAVGDEDHGGDFCGGELLRGGRQRPQKRRCLAHRRQGRQALRPVQRLGLLGEGDRQQAEIALELLAPFFQLAAGLIEPRYARGVVGDAHRRRRIEQKDDRRLFDQLVLITEHGAEQQQHDQHDGHGPQRQQDSPSPGGQRAERPIVKHPRQQDRHGGDRQHRDDAVTLGKCELHGRRAWVLGLGAWGLDRAAKTQDQRPKTQNSSGFVLRRLFPFPFLAGLLLAFFQRLLAQLYQFGIDQ